MKVINSESVGAITKTNILDGLVPSPIESDIETFKQQLRLKTHQYGDFNFEDDEWYYAKLHRSSAPNSAYTINFNECSLEYKDWLKYFTLMEKGKVSSLRYKNYNVNCFLEFFTQKFPDFKLRNINRVIINQYETFLREQENNSAMVRHNRYGHLKVFFKLMGVYPEFPDEIPTKNKNPFPIKIKDNSEKYIPTNIVKQFDRVMMDENHDIPDSFRLAYWLQRSYPNRITEVTSIPIKCLKPLYDAYVINVPTTKQNNGFIQEEIKTIPVIYTGHGKYVVELIKKVQSQTKELLKLHPFDEKYKTFLLLSTSFELNINNGKITSYNSAEVYRKLLEIRDKFPKHKVKNLLEELSQAGYTVSDTLVRRQLAYGLSKKRETLLPYSSGRFNKILERIATLCHITDENGKIFKPASHEFRHNATTDRLYIGGYTMEQVMVLRNDKGKTMPNTYVHQQKEMHKKMTMEASRLKSPSDSPVEFKGRIFNLADQKVVERLSRDSRAYLTWETNGKKGVGLCSMISGCKPDGTSIHFECYECNWFVPKAEYYDDYKKELEYWNGIADDSAGQLKRAATFENAMRNVTCLERIVNICENGIDKHKKDIEQKIESGELR